MKLTTSICLTDTLLKEIDNQRGLIPRSAYIEFLINLALSKKQKGRCDEV